MLIKNEINCASLLTRKHTTSLATENARGLSYDQTISIVFHPTCTYFSDRRPLAVGKRYICIFKGSI